MGIASGIFWIAIGALYILYRAFRERPGDTISGIVLFLILGGGTIAWGLCFRALLDWNIIAGVVFSAISMIVLGWYIVHINREASKKRKDYAAKFERALRIAMTEPIDEADLKKYEETFWKKSCGKGSYAEEKRMYMAAKDKSAFRSIIVRDYIENHRVYKIMQNM